MKNNFIINCMLLLVIIALIVFPLIYKHDAEFAGADDSASKIILENNPEYEPWIDSIWEPPGKEIESLLFALQAAIGASISGLVIGYYIGKHKKNNVSY